MVINMNEKTMKMISLEELLYFGFFLLLSITKGFGFYDGQKLFLLLVIPALLLGLGKILLTPYTKRQWVMVAVLLLVVYNRVSSALLEKSEKLKITENEKYTL